jgi:energy-coupling factor transporter ATP-binding protein EcfA2
MQRELIIGLAGIKGSGKSTVADILTELIPNVEIVAWADALKEEVCEMVNHYEACEIDLIEMEDLKTEVFGPLFQGWGAFRRHYFGDDYWISAWNFRAPDRVIIPDCRHHNEAEYIKANGGILLYVNGPSRWEGDTRSPTHESERYIPQLRKMAYGTIDNFGTLQELRDRIEMALEVILDGAGTHAGIPA